MYVVANGFERWEAKPMDNLRCRSEEDQEKEVGFSPCTLRNPEDWRKIGGVGEEQCHWK